MSKKNRYFIRIFSSLLEKSRQWLNPFHHAILGGAITTKFLIFKFSYQKWLRATNCEGGTISHFSGKSKNTWHSKRGSGTTKCHQDFFAFWNVDFNAFGRKKEMIRLYRILWISSLNKLKQIMRKNQCHVRSLQKVSRNGHLHKPPWRNWLARSAVNRKVGGSSPPGGE